MKLTIGNLYKVGNTECTLREVKAETTTFWEYGEESTSASTKYTCLMVNEDGFTKWVEESELKEI